MIKLSTCCHHCGQHLALADGWHGFVVNCPDCIDPDEVVDACLLQGRGATPDDALQNWFDRREELGLEPEATLTALATFIVPRSPEGYLFQVTRPDILPDEPCRLGSYASANSYATAGRGDYAPLPIFYGPFVGQKAANDS